MFLIIIPNYFVQCYRVLLIFHGPDESGLQQQAAA